MVYGYVRVSTLQQNIDRQLDEMHRFGLPDEQIFIDKQSGKDFDREHYQRLVKGLKQNDLLVIKSIDRLGRDYAMIIEEWTRITKTIGADMLVLDMPLLDTRQKAENLVGKFISDIVLQILSFVAQNERETIRQRQAEGIRLAKLKGIHLGRPALPLPENFDMVAKRYISGELNNFQARKLLEQMTKGTFFRHIRRLRMSISTKNHF